MQIGNIVLQRPKPTQIASFAIWALLVLLMFYGLGSSIEDGDIRNHPEILRWLFFIGFSFGLAIRLSFIIGFKDNRWPARIILFILSYILVGASGAHLIGII